MFFGAEFGEIEAMAMAASTIAASMNIPQ